MLCRPVLPTDRGALADLLARTDAFTADERAVALELIDEALAKPDDPTAYRVLVAVEPTAGGERLLGYVCFGRTPMTESTGDFYWAAVEPTARKRGIGRFLHDAMLAACRAEGIQRLRIETSSQESYGGTLAFHHALGYQTVSVAKDFYKEGDDLITLFRIVGPA